MRKIIRIFTRDFGQWTNQMVRDHYVDVFPTLWGCGLEDQLVHFTGRSFVWYRYKDDYRKLVACMIEKSPDDPIFSEPVQTQYREHVRALRALIATQGHDPVAHLEKITELYGKMYPYYALGVFLPGPWRERYIERHRKQGEAAVARIFKSRQYSEGLLKEVDMFLRAWLGPLLERRSYSRSYAKLLSREEIERFLKDDVLPDTNTLAARAKGYVHIDGEIIPTTNFHEFLNDRDLILEQDSVSDSTTVRGTVASKGGVITGEVKTLFNTHEVPHFPNKAILVSPMTSPEYVPAMKKAKAIVTDEGGLSCHAAIVSRELGIPCVIGTKFATKIFHDGDAIEVDAGTGVVRKRS